MEHIIEVAFSLLSKLLTEWRWERNLQYLCLIRDELRNKKESCQYRAKRLDGEIITSPDIYQALLHHLRLSYDETEQVLEIIKKAQQAGTVRSRHLIGRIDVPSAFLDITYELGWFAYFDQVLSNIENLLETKRSLSRNHIKPINQARRNYENLKQNIAGNIRYAIREARDEGKLQHCVVEDLLLFKLKSIIRDNDIITQSVRNSISQVRNLIVQIARKEKEQNHRLPDDLFEELVVYQWRDYLLSELEDRLEAKVA